MSEHPLIEEHRALFGVSHTCLGRNLRGNRVGRRKTAAEEGPISHEAQEARLANSGMWVPHKSFQPARIAVEGAQGYASKIHLPDPHAQSYANVRTSVDNLRSIGRAYDALPMHDPRAVPHFEALRKEIGDQHDHMTHAMGIRTEVVDHDPYPSVHHMVQDVLNNKRIKVLSTAATGGHSFLSDEDNDKFRAVHDVFGHAATGRGFDAHGEEGAWLAHSRMFTPHARPAMSSETRGQNAALHINGSFQAQKTALLPRHMWDDDAMSKHTRLLPFEAFLKQAHDSGDGETIYHCPFCGSGQVIARSDRTIECQFCHTCFTVQVQPEYPAFPQTINGVPVEVPGMPGQTGMDPSGAGGPAPQDPDMAAAGGFPPADGEAPAKDEGDDDKDDDGGNPFAKGSMLRTQAGKTLPVEDYLAHLALRHTQDRPTTLEAVRARRV